MQRLMSSEQVPALGPTSSKGPIGSRQTMLHSTALPLERPAEESLEMKSLQPFASFFQHFLSGWEALSGMTNFGDFSLNQVTFVLARPTPLAEAIPHSQTRALFT